MKKVSAIRLSMGFLEKVSAVGALISLLVLFYGHEALAKPVTLNVVVTEKGFQPAQLSTQAGEDVILRVTRTTNDTCAKAVQVPSLNIKKALPLNRSVTIALGKLPKGDIKFGCTMDMMESAIIHVD